MTGLLALGNGFGTSPGGDGVDLIGTNSIGNTIGGSTAAAGNIISANAYDGIYLDHASNDTLEFNRVGADAAQNFGNTAMGNADMGIELDNALKITISQNLIVNNRTGGIALFYPPDRQRFDQQQRNHPERRRRHPVLCVWRWRQRDLRQLDRHGRIGHGQSGQQGVRHRHRQRAITRSAARPRAMPTSSPLTPRPASASNNLNTDTGNTLSANSIYSNQTLGIDLGESGVPLQNNSGGVQVGPNALQNYPVLASASASIAGTTHHRLTDERGQPDVHDRVFQQ